MPTLEGSYHRLELVQSSDKVIDVLSPDRTLVLQRGLTARIDCALFSGPEAESDTLVSDVSNIVSARFTVRKHNAHGTALIDKQINTFTSTTYDQWTAGTGKQFTFDLSAIDTNQTLPAAVPLPIYFAVTVTTASHTFTAGSGTGQIIETGTVGITTPLPATLPPTTISGNFTAGGNITATGTISTEGVAIHAKSTSRNVFYASQIGLNLDSNVLTGGGTDDTSALNNTLSDIGALGGGTFVLDGAALISASLRLPSKVAIQCLNKSCGVFLASGSNCHMVTNSNFTSLTNPHEPSGGSRQKNISIIGGTWNGNYAGQTVYVNNNVLNSWVCGMWFNGVDNLYLQNVTIYDARKLCLMMTYLGNSDVIDYTASYPTNRQDNNDALHVWGPATGQLTVRNLRAINTSDDVLALNYCESRVGQATGEVDFTGRAAAVSTLIDGVYIENGHSILRVDGTVASVGSITVRNVVANLNDNVALTLLTYGTWKRLLCENWTVNVPLAAAAGIPKGVIIDNPRNGSVTEFRNWRHTADGSVHSTDTQKNSLITVITGDLAGSETPAAKILLDNVIVDKPATPRSGVLLYFHGNATARVFEEIVVRNSTLLKDGYGYIVQNDLPGATIGSLSLPDNTLNGAQLLIGSLPPDGLQEPWNAPTLLNSWVNYGSGQRVAGYRKDHNGRVWLCGLIKSGVTTLGTDIFILPTGYRPANNSVEIFGVFSNNALGAIQVLPAGNVQIVAGSNVNLSLAGISFSTD